MLFALSGVFASTLNTGIQYSARIFQPHSFSAQNSPLCGYLPNNPT